MSNVLRMVSAVHALDCEMRQEMVTTLGSGEVVDHLRVLIRLVRYNYPPTVLILVRDMDWTRSTCSRVLARMAEAGWVEVLSTRTDWRMREVYTTDAGHEYRQMLEERVAYVAHAA